MRLTKTVGEYLFGRGSLGHLDSLLPRDGDGVVFLIDHFFQDRDLPACLPTHSGDQVIYVDTSNEPTTEGIDALTAEVRSHMAKVSAVVGIGGGSTLDTAKAVSNMLGNDGQAADYQGWDLLPNKGVFKVGVPTLSGTGAEASRTCVMMNTAKNLKLGMNSDHTVFDCLVLDPDLTASVSRDQYFYTGMDTYIHCVESLGGSFRHAVADAYSREALELCRRIFLDGNMMASANREALMVASYLGGSGLANSFVGLVHPFSAGLSMVFKTRHCLANCLVMNVMDEFYPEAVKDFRAMMKAQGVVLPHAPYGALDGDTLRRLYDATIVHDRPLRNALGDYFKDVLTFETVSAIFRRIG